MESQQLSLDSDMSKLTASLKADETSDSANKTIDDAISGGGGAIGSMATMKKPQSQTKHLLQPVQWRLYKQPRQIPNPGNHTEKVHSR